MKKIVYIVFLISFVSCVSHKRISEPVIYDPNTEKMQKAFQQAKDKFLMSDSADAIMQDIGWTQQVVSGAKIVGKIPSVYKTVTDESFSIEYPCWEYDSPQYATSNVFVEHMNLDSALVRAKVQGVDDIYSRSATNETFHYNEKKEFILDRIEYTEKYAEYMRKAQFSCLCITRDKKKYIVNATIRVPNMNHISDDDMLGKFEWNAFRKLVEEKWKEHKQNHDTIKTEKAETPLE